MNNHFDELTKGLAQSVTRRQALRRFGIGVGGAVLPSLGVPNRASASPKMGSYCEVANGVYTGKCVVGPFTPYPCGFWYTTNCNPEARLPTNRTKVAALWWTSRRTVSRSVICTFRSTTH